jgi:hypothetical protein
MLYFCIYAADRDAQFQHVDDGIVGQFHHFCQDLDGRGLLALEYYQDFWGEVFIHLLDHLQEDVGETLLTLDLGLTLDQKI